MAWRSFPSHSMGLLVCAIILTLACGVTSWLAGIEKCLAPGIEDYPTYQAILNSLASFIIAVSGIYFVSRAHSETNRPTWIVSILTIFATALFIIASLLSYNNVDACDDRSRPTNWHERETYQIVTFALGGTSIVFVVLAMIMSRLYKNRDKPALNLDLDYVQM